MKIRTILLSFFYIPLVLNGQQADSTIQKLTFLFGGDIMGHDTQIKYAYQPDSGGYDYTPCFQYVKPLFQQTDIVVTNLEVTLAGPPYKGYPQFSSPDELAVALKNAGVNYLITANNHSLDRGKQGLERTITVLDSLNISHTGTFRDLYERDSLYPLIIEKKGFKIALLNYTYGTNGIPVQSPNVVNYMDTTQMRLDLIKAQFQDPDFIITTVHWGLEYQREENETQRNIAAFLLQHGSNVVIGSHPHVVQPINVYPDDTSSCAKSIVVYSLGNLISNQRTPYRDGGIFFRMELSKADSTWISRYGITPFWVQRKDYENFYVIPVPSYQKDPGKYDLSDQDSIKLTDFYLDTKKRIPNIPEMDGGD